jgi:putative ABC transport system permease protein
MTELIELTPLQLLLSLALIAAAIALSAWFRLGLEGSLAIATGRTIVQLLVVGYLLTIVFSIRNPFLVLAVIAVMIGIATVVARNRISQKIPRLIPIVGGALSISTLLTLVYVNFAVIRPETWYEPQYVIPLAGILLGNAMSGAAIAGERFVSSLNNHRLDIETHLSLGATPNQAIASYRREAVGSGLIPTLNAMTVVGVVTLPGIITGQLLSGVSPINAAAYQMLIMFMLAFVTLAATVLVIQGIYSQAFNRAAQLLHH